MKNKSENLKFLIQNLLQSYNNQDSMSIKRKKRLCGTGWHKYRHTDQWNKI